MGNAAVGADADRADLGLVAVRRWGAAARAAPAANELHALENDALSEPRPERSRTAAQRRKRWAAACGIGPAECTARPARPGAAGTKQANLEKLDAF